MTCGPPASDLQAVVIDPDLKEQAFRPWVHFEAEIIKSLLTEYRRKNRGSLDFPRFKSRFLLKEDLREAVFLFSYSVARFINLSNPYPWTWTFGRSDFARNLCLDLLFDLTLVIESTIPRPAPHQWKFIALAANLSKAAKLGLSIRDLGKINGYFIEDFEETMKQALDQSLTVANQQVRGSAAALAVAYGCRNRGAHKVSSASVVGDRFPEIFVALMETLFLAVETFH